jgi:hypothetical protein
MLERRIRHGKEVQQSAENPDFCLSGSLSL